MTNPIPSVILRYIEGLKTHDVEQIASTVAEEMGFVTPVKTMTKPQFVAFIGALYTGFPDWHYEHDPIEIRRDGIIAVRWYQGGHHTGTLALPGFGSVAATGKKVQIPPHYFFYKVAGDLITEIRPDPVPGGAPRGIFEQIGVAIPPL